MPHLTALKMKQRRAPIKSLADLAAARADLAAVRADLEIERTAHAALQEVIAQTVAEVDARDVQIQKFVCEVDDLRAGMADARAAIRAKNAAIDALTTQLATAQTEIHSLQTEIHRPVIFLQPASSVSDAFESVAIPRLFDWA